MDPRKKRLRTAWMISCFIFLLTVFNLLRMDSFHTVRTVDLVMIFASGMAFGAMLASTVAVIKNARANDALV